MNPVGSHKVPVEALHAEDPLLAIKVRELNLVDQDGNTTIGGLLGVAKENEQLKRESRYSRSVIFGLVVAMVLQALVTVAGTYATASWASPVQTNTDGMLTNKNGQPVATAVFSQYKELNSEMPPDVLQGVQHINMALGDGAKQASSSVAVRGFSQETCVDSCTSKHIVNFYTSEGTFVYHGSEAYIADPSPEFQKVLDSYGMVQQPDGQTPTGSMTGQRKLWIWFVARSVGSWFASNYAWDYGKSRRWWR